MSCVADGTGGGMIQTPDDHFQHADHAWKSGLLEEFVPKHLLKCHLSLLI